MRYRRISFFCFYHADLYELKLPESYKPDQESRTKCNDGNNSLLILPKFSIYMGS